MTATSMSASDRALFYSQLAFLREHERDLSAAFLSSIAEGSAGSLQVVGERARAFVRYLKWDSEHFRVPTYRVDFTEWDRDVEEPAEELARTLRQFRDHLATTHDRYQLWAEVPSEDVATLQAAGSAGFRLIETRLTYFTELASFSWPERYAVRQATPADIPNLREIAIEARNHFDRVHADPFFSPAVADEYLATFAENSVRGFADLVLVPADGSGPPGAFFTAKIDRGAQPRLDTARIVLVAVGRARRGWHLRLLSEMSYWLKERGVSVAHMTTQATNRAVIRNCEKLDFRYGRSAHVLAVHKGRADDGDRS